MIAASPTLDQAHGAHVDAALLSHVGRVRANNEDAAYVDPEGLFFIVADGVGGEAGGEVASATAVDVVRRALERIRGDIEALQAASDARARAAVVEALGGAVLSANATVRNLARHDRNRRRMATTLDVVIIAGSEAFVAHVGDSRTYLLRRGRATQLTDDHTMARLMVQTGTIAREEDANGKLRRTLVSCIGLERCPRFDVRSISLRPGDRLLSCSDGLYQYFRAEELAGCLSSGSLLEGLSIVVDLATIRGGRDNITGVLAELVAG